MPLYLITQDDLDYFNQIGTNFSINGELVEVNSPLNLGDRIDWETKENYLFEVDYPNHTPSILWERHSDGRLNRQTLLEQGNNRNHYYRTNLSYSGQDTHSLVGFKAFTKSTLTEVFSFDLNVINYLEEVKVDCYVNNSLVVEGIKLINGSTVRLEPREGYELESASFTKLGSARFFNRVGDNLIYTVDGDDLLTNLTIVNNEIVIPVVYTFDSDVLNYLDSSNVDCYVDSEEVQIGTELINGSIVTIYSREGYELESASFTRLGIVDSFTKTFDYMRYVVTSNDELYNLTVVNTEIVVPPYHVINNDDLEVFNSKGVKLYVNNILIFEGMELFRDDLLKAVAPSNRVFRDYSVGYKFNNGTNYFVLEESLQIANGKVGFSIFHEDFEYFFCEVFQPRPELVKGYNNVYLLNDRELREFTNSIFTAGSIQNPEDYGKYILGLIKFPFILDEEYLLEKEGIILGNAYFEIEGMLMATDTISLEVGEVEIDRVYGDFRDFKNVSVNLHLPYCPIIPIPPEYVIGSSIKANFTISLYDGKTIVTIHSSKIDGRVIESMNVDLNIEIPYTTVEKLPSTTMLGGVNSVNRMYVEIIQNEIVNIGNSQNLPTKVFGKLNDYVGYCLIDEINLSGEIGSFEQALILNELKNGVIIK